MQSTDEDDLFPVSKDDEQLQLGLHIGGPEIYKFIRTKKACALLERMPFLRFPAIQG